MSGRFISHSASGSSSEATILALRSEVERLKHKVNSVISSAEATLKQVQVENDAVRITYIEKEDLYLRELKELERDRDRYKNIFEVLRAEYDDEKQRYRETTDMMQTLRESSMMQSVGGGGAMGMAEMKEDTQSEGYLAHPGQLVMRSGNSWAIEVNKLRRISAGQEKEIDTMRSQIADLSRELGENKALLKVARAEGVNALSLLEEFQLSQSLLGKPRSRDQQLLGSIRAALDSSMTTHGGLLSKDLLASCSDEETLSAQHAQLYLQSLEELKELWKGSSDSTFHVMLERLTEKLAECRVILSEKSDEVERARRTLVEQVTDKEVVLQKLAQEHEHAAHWQREKEALNSRIEEQAGMLRASDKEMKERTVSANMLHQRVDELEQQTRLAMSDLEIARGHVEAAEKERAAFSLHATELENLLADMSNKCENQQGRLMALEAELRQCKEQAKADSIKAFEDVYSLQQSLSSANATARDCSVEAEDHRRRCATIEAEMAIQSQQCESTKSVLQEKKLEVQSMMKELVSLRSELGIVTIDKETNQLKVQTLSETINANWREMDDVKRKLQATVTANEAAEKEKQALQSKLSESIQNAEALRKQLAEVSRSLVDVQNELQNCTQILHESTVAHVSEMHALGEHKGSEISALAEQLAFAEAQVQELANQAQIAEDRWSKKNEAWAKENRMLLTEKEEMQLHLESAATVSANKIAEAEARAAASARQGDECRALMEQAQRETRSLKTSLDASKDRLETAEMCMVEVRTSLEICQMQLQQKSDDVVNALGAKEALVAEHKLIIRQLDADVARYKQVVDGKDDEISFMNNKIVALQSELDGLRPGIQQLLQETKHVDQLTQELKAAHDKTADVSQSLEALKIEKEEAESSYRSADIEASAKIAEMRGLFATKEARLKELIHFAKENIKKLEDGALERERDFRSRENDLREKHLSEVRSLNEKIDEQTKLNVTLRREREFSEQHEKSLAKQLGELQERHKNLGEKFQAKTLENSQHMTEMAERMHTSERQSKFFERQAGFSAEEFRKRDDEIKSLQGIIKQQADDIAAFRKDRDMLLEARTAERENFIQEMEDLRENSTVVLGQTCSAQSLEFEVASRAITEQLWASEKKRQTLESEVAEKAATLHSTKQALGLCQQQLSREAKAREADKQEHEKIIIQLREESKNAASVQLQNMAKVHSVTLESALKSQLAEAERQVKLHQQREVELEKIIEEATWQSISGRSQAANKAQLEEHLQEEITKNAHLSNEVMRLSTGFAEESAELQEQLEQSKQRSLSLQAERNELTAKLNSLEEAFDEARRDERRARDEERADHAHALAEAKRGLETENSKLNLTLVQTRNEMLVMLKKHVSELEDVRSQHSASDEKNSKAREQEVESIKRETRELTERYAHLQVGSAAQMRVMREEHEAESRELLAQLRLIEEQNSANLRSMHQIKLESEEKLAATIESLTQEAEKKFKSQRAEFETKAAEAEKERSKLTERALNARRDQHSALEAHERTLSAALSAAETEKQRELATAREAAVQTQTQLQTQLQAEVQSHMQAQAQLQAQIQALIQSEERLKREAQAHQQLHAELQAENQREMAAAHEAVMRAKQEAEDEQSRARAEAQAAMQELKQKLERMEELASAHEQGHALLQVEAAAHQEMHAHASTERDTLVSALKQREIEVENLTHRLAKHESSNRDFVTSVAQLQRHVDEIEADKKDLRQQLETALADLSAARAASTATHNQALEDLKKDLELSRAETEALAESLSKSQVLSNRYTRNVSALESQVAALKASLEARPLETPGSRSSLLSSGRQMLSGSHVEPLSTSAYLSPLRRATIRVAYSPRGSEIDDTPERKSSAVAALSPFETPGFEEGDQPALSSEDAAQADVQMAEIRSALPALSKSGDGDRGNNQAEATTALQLLHQSVACYDTLKMLHQQAEDEYNAAARILIDAAEANRTKMHARVEQYQRKAEQATSLYSKLKVKLVNERLEYREELENLRLRLLSGSAHIEGDSFDSDGSRNPSPKSTYSDSRSQFSVLTDTMED